MKGLQLLKFGFGYILAFIFAYCYAVSVAYVLNRKTKLGEAWIVAFGYACMATVASLVLASVLFFCGCVCSLATTYK